MLEVAVGDDLNVLDRSGDGEDLGEHVLCEREPTGSGRSGRSACQLESSHPSKPGRKARGDGDEPVTRGDKFPT